MTRARAAWLAAGVVVLAALAYLVRRRRTAATPLPASAPVAPTVVAADSAAPTRSDLAVVSELPPVEELPAPAEVRDIGQDAELPLATWARVAIVAVALLAFFAVSLIATKQV